MENQFPLFQLKILIAEDSTDIRVLLHRVLEKQGASVTGAFDGADAVSQAVRIDFDLILMDLQMPNLSGSEAAIKIRAGGFEGPIIAMTGHSSDYVHDVESDFSASRSDHDKAFHKRENIFDGYLQKPVPHSHLIQTVLSFCNKI
ncbi:MAG: response regulator [Oligoflexus sp.]|nr:response regulator [Oligoflexus sp.]